jgi:hypothetical protein
MDMTLSKGNTRLISLVVVFFLGLMLSSSQALAEPMSYAGAYATDLVWEGTVTMSGDVLILPGATLTVRAGTQVNVIPAEGTKIDPEYLSPQTELLIRGRLKIQGTADRPVRFVAQPAAEEQDIAWSGITLDKASDSQISFAVLTRADIAIRCVGSSPVIQDNRIVDCRYGIVAQQKSHPKILGNTLIGGEGGVFCWRESNPYLLDNQITAHDEEAVFVDASSRPWLDRNTITDNAIGLAIYPRDLPFDQTAITGNRENVRWLGHQGQDGDL